MDDDIQREQKQLQETQRRGAILTFGEIGKLFGELLLKELPILKEVVVGPLLDDSNFEGVGVSSGKNPCASSDSPSKSQGDKESTPATAGTVRGLIESLQTLEVLVPSVHSALYPELRELLPRLDLCARHNLAAVRHMAARCMASLAVADTR